MAQLELGLGKIQFQRKDFGPAEKTLRAAAGGAFRVSSS